MAATTQVRLLVWSCRYAAEIRGKVDRVPADRRRCLVVVTDAHSRLENKQEMQRPGRGTDGIVIMPQWIWKVFNFPGSLDTRFSSLCDMHLGARFKTTSSSGQDVALWP